LGDAALLQSIASVPFTVYALSSLGNSGFISFVLVLASFIARDFFLALASTQSSFDAKVLEYTLSTVANVFGLLFVWLWGLYGGFRGLLITAAFTASVELQRAAWIVGEHGLNLLGDNNTQVVAIVHIFSALAPLLLVALFYSTATSSCPAVPAAATARTAAAPKKVDAAKKKN
jgi:hypothetical protein